MITELMRFSTHDGPGIRTTVFFKGCSLACAWCSNPETLRPGRDLYVISRRCGKCGRCVETCPKLAITFAPEVTVDRKTCDVCLKCVEECPKGVFRAVGKEFGVGPLVAEIAKDRMFFNQVGGVTLSGGEPLSQPDFVLSLLEKCRQSGIGAVLDTSGYAPAPIAEAAARLSDLVLFDLKHMDASCHRRETGVDNAIILENAVRMSHLSRLRISLPLIPGFNDGEDNIRRTLEFTRKIGAVALDINPLHALGMEKYHALGRPPLYDHFGIVDRERILRIAALAGDFGLEVTIGRMM